MSPILDLLTDLDRRAEAYYSKAHQFRSAEDQDRYFSVGNRIMDAIELMREALRVIAAPDTLLDANAAAFSGYAAKRMQAIAKAAIDGADGR